MLLSKSEFMKGLAKGKIGYILEATGELNQYRMMAGELIDCCSGQRFNQDDFMEYEYYSFKLQDLISLDVPACVWQSYQHFNRR